MTNLVLIDTSAWIEYFRPEGDSMVAAQVDEALDAHTVCTCEMILLELERGSGSGQAKATSLISSVSSLYSIDKTTWEESYRIAQLLRKKGKPVPNSDILIYACSVRHALGIIHNDKHFDILGSVFKS